MEEKMADKIITLENGYLTVKISDKGAELQSVGNKSGTEFIWYGDEKIWSARAPLLFPICGGLKDDKYIYEGNEYFLGKHGYAKLRTFKVESVQGDKAVFLLTSDEESRTQYPFDYELRVTYLLDGNSLRVTYDVLNTSNGNMYFSVGAHEGYLCPEGIEEYSVVFDQDENLESYVLDGNLLENDTLPVPTHEKTLDLKYDYFAVDALVFKNVKSRSVTLVHKNSSKKVRVDFEGFPYLLLWTKPAAPYICIEPWCGIQDGVDSDYDFKSKDGIEALASGGTFARTHTITFEE